MYVRIDIVGIDGFVCYWLYGVRFYNMFVDIYKMSCMLLYLLVLIILCEEYSIIINRMLK